MQFGEDQVFQEFGFDFMTPIACKKSVKLMRPLWGDRIRDLGVCNEVVSIITDAKLVRERDLCHFRALLQWAKGQQLL